jgi:uncharacterized protein (DUF2141 family)
MKEGEYASISARIKSSRPYYTVELLDQNLKVVERWSNPTQIKVNYLKPGAYYLRAFDDRNKNGKWDKGDFKENIQPEEIFLYKDKIDLRANWEVEDILFEF